MRRIIGPSLLRAMRALAGSLPLIFSSTDAMPANSSAMPMKGTRQFRKSDANPPTSMPEDRPRIWPARKRASTGCRCSYGTTSPSQAIDSGMIAPAVAPASRRPSSSIW